MLRKLKHRFAASWRRGLAGAAIATALGFLFWLPRLSIYSDQLTFLDELSFDSLHGLRAPARMDEVRIIEMDEKSERELGLDANGFWDRGRHAELLRKLTNDGASVVVFDVFFARPADSPKEAEKDRMLADAMRAHGKVAVVAHAESVTRADFAGLASVPPAEPMRSAAAAAGIAIIMRDTDGVVRRHFVESELHESLPWAAARLAGAAAMPEVGRLQQRWLRYYGPRGAALPHMSYVDALNQPNGLFREKLVFIGGTPRIKRPGQESDVFRTPYTRWDAEESGGVEILATNTLNLLRNEWLTRCPPLAELLLIALAGLVAGFVSAALRPWLALAAGLVMAAGLAGFALLLCSQAQVWFSWLLPAGIGVPSAWLWSVYARRRAERSIQATQAAPKPTEPAAGTPAVAEVQTVVNAQKTALAASSRIPDHDLMRCVGRGAYGEVWLARNAIGLFHAVKIIYRRSFESDAPYEREFRGITKFMPISRSHTGFVHVLHVGRDDAAGYFYYIMEAGDDEATGQDIHPETYSAKNLARELRHRRRLPVAECVRLALSLGETLDHLHRAQLIHRDIKPSNIIFVGGVPKLADIGLVTDVAADRGEVTYLGTKGYIAPEGPGSPAADIYSLGKVLYEAATGLDREQFPNLPTTLLSTSTDAFARLNQIILKACETDPKARYTTASELLQDLRGLSFY